MAGPLIITLLTAEQSHEFRKKINEVKLILLT